MPGLAAGDIKDLGQRPEQEGDCEAEPDGDESCQEHLDQDEVDQADQAAQETPDHVLVPLCGQSGRCEQHADERERQPECIGLQLGREEPGPPGLLVDLQLDRIGGGAERLVGRAQSEARLPDEGGELAGPLADLRVVRGALDLVEHLPRPVEPDDVELVPEEAPLPAFHDELHVREVGLDVRGLKSLVECVDESLGLLLDPA